MLSIEEFGFICVSIRSEIAIIINPIMASSLPSTYFDISPAAIKPIKQTTALGNIKSPDIEGL